MKTLKAHLKESLKNDKFKKIFEEEKTLLNVSLILQKERKNAGLSQKELAESAHLTQQQVSKVENGTNCNIMTYLKAGHVVGLRMNFEKLHRRRQFAKV
jgi:HTH-type transcriptional regulator/antitoxin HipB